MNVLTDRIWHTFT